MTQIIDEHWRFSVPEGNPELMMVLNKAKANRSVAVLLSLFLFPLEVCRVMRRERCLDLRHG
ncbi:MAG: hypothetical protein ACYYK0_04155 [Candidatus Eutrophobiaceae bacterium]